MKKLATLDFLHSFIPGRSPGALLFLEGVIESHVGGLCERPGLSFQSPTRTR